MSPLSLFRWKRHCMSFPVAAARSSCVASSARSGYAVEAQSHPLDPTFPEWGDSPYFTVRLTGTVRLSELLTHLYVLIPTLNIYGKHYAIGDAEVEKLISKGEGWLAAHPEKEAIVRRYLKHHHSLVQDALTMLTQEDELEADAVQEQHDREEAAVERKISLHDQRLGAVLAALKQSGAKRVLDLGCGEGRLLSLLLKDRQFTDVLGMDVSYARWRSRRRNCNSTACRRCSGSAYA